MFRKRQSIKKKAIEKKRGIDDAFFFVALFSSFFLFLRSSNLALSAITLLARHLLHLFVGHETKEMTTLTTSTSNEKQTIKNQAPPSPPDSFVVEKAAAATKESRAVVGGRRRRLCRRRARDVDLGTLHLRRALLCVGAAAQRPRASFCVPF